METRLASVSQVLVKNVLISYSLCRESMVEKCLCSLSCFRKSRKLYVQYQLSNMPQSWVSSGAAWHGCMNTAQRTVFRTRPQRRCMRKCGQACHGRTPLTHCMFVFALFWPLRSREPSAALKSPPTFSSVCSSGQSVCFVVGYLLGRRLLPFNLCDRWCRADFPPSMSWYF